MVNTPHNASRGSGERFWEVRQRGENAATPRAFK